MIIDYGNGNLIYYTAAAPYYWTNNLEITGGVVGSLYVDPDIFFHGLIEGGAVVGIPSIPRVVIVRPLIAGKALYGNFDRLHARYDISAKSHIAVRDYESINLDPGI